MSKQRGIPGVLKKHWRLSMWSVIMLAVLVFTAEVALTTSLDRALSVLLLLSVWSSLVTYLVGSLSEMLSSR